MDLLVKHSGTNITSHVLGYEREHKICTGIGTLKVEIERTISRTFDPWDSVDIWENGSFQVRYYISNVVDSVPDGKITLECQDLSKKLVDFFIPDSYTIDYPSYTRYWIELFLDMAGVDYIFNTASSGNLISNNTQLGLVPAYEQILVLLQLSGWYMYFDGNGKAVIGPLETDLASTTRKLAKTDIISIAKLSDDKMLRNRALVLGAFDPYSLSYASADVTIHTRWNYDNRDVRAMVVANSNIPNRGSAYSIANMLIKEFSRLTIEKHIVATGARNFNLGEACQVNSNVWRGKGLITTFGVRASKDGLYTDIVLDERCPRLFGFFDFGDFVYVGTFGDGIWRKHLKFDPTWYNFSTGLTNLNITDLHINNGVFGSIGASGEMYYATSEDGGWNRITLSGFLSSQVGTTASGDSINMIPFSGLMGRAVIVDRQSNLVRYGIDNASGILNYGDYFINYSGWTSGITTSGFVTASGYRGWIYEQDVFGGGNTVYPISVSGEYDLTVIDLENDGFNDYVSVKMGGGGAIPMGLDGYELGKHTTSQTWNTHDSTSIVSLPIFPDGTELEVHGVNGITTQRAGVAMIDDGITGEREIIYHDTFLNQLRRVRYSKDISGNITSSTTSTSFNITSDRILRIHWMSKDNYRIYYFPPLTSNMVVKYKDWDVAGNVLGSEQTAFSHTFSGGGAGGEGAGSGSLYISVGNTGYILTSTFFRSATAGGINVNPEYYRLFMIQIDLDAGSGSMNKIYELVTPETAPGSGRYEIIPGQSHFDSDSPGNLLFGLFQDGDTGISIVGWLEYGAFSVEWTELLLNGNAAGVTTQVLNYTTSNSRFTGSLLTSIDGSDRYSQLTKTMGVITADGSGAGSPLGFATNGHTFVTFVGQAPYYLKANTIYPIFSNTENKYIARDTNNYWACDATLITPLTQITPPTGYGLDRPLSNATSFNNEIMWVMDDAFNDTWLTVAPSVQASPATGRYKIPSLSSNSNRSINVGGWIVDAPSTFSTTNPNFLSAYIWYGAGDLPSARFLVLQRNGESFTIVEEEAYPIRVDISNNSPLLTVGSGDLSFKSNYIYPGELEVIYNPIASGLRKVDDYRYSLLEPTFGVTASGLGVETLGLYVTGSGVFGQDIRTYSGGWQLIYDVPSGYGTRIETSNYGLGGQYVFITASGFVQTFWQKNPEEFGFTAYSGMPQARATIIRLDDRI